MDPAHWRAFVSRDLVLERDIGQRSMWAHVPSSLRVVDAERNLAHILLTLLL